MKANFPGQFQALAGRLAEDFVKGMKMTINNTQSKLFSWVFWALSVGMLVASGIFIEKIVLTQPAALDYIAAVGFAVAGAAISAYKFLASSD
jgi:hypothetical protein